MNNAGPSKMQAGLKQRLLRRSRQRLPSVALSLGWLAACWICTLNTIGAEPSKYFKIMVVDQQTRRGVPLVELQTVNAIRYVTDSNGIVAFYEPGLMNQTVFFSIRSHGYEFPKDGFGYRGTRVQIVEGGSVQLEVKRINVAERLYRITGGGIYRDSVLVGHPVPLRHPLLNGLVLGQDSVLNAVYGGRLIWFWGDTNWPRYPLGNFHVPGATSQLPQDGGLRPQDGVDLEYFLDKRGFAKSTAALPGRGPTWLDGLTVLADGTGKKRLFAKYVKIAKPMSVYERGIVEFDDEEKVFQPCLKIALDAPLVPDGHPFKHSVSGTEYVYFSSLTRVPATVSDFLDLAQYEAFSCFEPGSRSDSLELDYQDDGRLRYAWKKNTCPLTQKLQQQLIANGRLKPQQAWFHVTDIETGKPVNIHHRSVYWNDYRHRWVMITSQSFGTSMLGEVWCAEADTPIGPWVYARKIVTHDKVSFYNPKQHPMFARKGGREIFFEGTYTHTFSGNPDCTPRYDYNQIMYRLDLDDQRLVLPVPVYRSAPGDAPQKLRLLDRRNQERWNGAIEFFALDRNKAGAIAVYERPAAGGGIALHTDPTKPAGEALFFALPPDMDPAPPDTVPLYEYEHEGGVWRSYHAGEDRCGPDARRAQSPLCLVWRNPMDHATIFCDP